MKTETALLIELLEKCDELEKENFMQLVTISTLEDELKELKLRNGTLFGKGTQNE